MRITDIDTIPVEVPMKPFDEEGGLAPYFGGASIDPLPETLSYEEAIGEVEDGMTSVTKLLIRVETEDGVTGWGEISTNEQLRRVGEATVEDVIAPRLLGKSVADVTALFEEFPRFPTAYYRDVIPMMGAVELAMWDALGKTLEQPVYQFLGGKAADYIPIAFCMGLTSMEDARRKAKYAHEQGFTVLKTKGSRYWRSDVERIEAMHDAVDGQMEFRLDPNQMWDIQDAVRVGALLEDAGIYLQYLEQPIRIDSIGAFKRLRERLRQPIAGGNEDLYVPRNLFYLAREDAIDVGQPDLVAAGGLLGMKREAAVAAEANIPLAHHSGHDIGLKNAAKMHIMTSTSAFSLPADTTYYSMEDHILEEPLQIEDGHMEVPDRPGLAGPIDEDKVEQYRID